MDFVRQLALLASIAALRGASVRLGSLAAPRGLERMIAAAVLATAIAVTETLGLGLLAIGSSPLALVIAAGATWALAVWLLPKPELGVATEARKWLRDAGPTARALSGAVIGILAACVVYCLAHPELGIDSVQYHLPEVLAWIHSGHPGAIVVVAPEFQSAWYPLTNEIVLTWGMAISRSFVPVALWIPATTLVLIASATLALRRLAVGRFVTALAILAVIAAPNYAALINTAKNDPATLTWLIAAGALTLAAGRTRPRLFAVAIVAVGLSVGTKSTSLPQAALLLIVGFIRLERKEAWTLATAAALAVITGGIWYIRDFIVHGSPLWPETPAPWGTPSPIYVARSGASFLSDPIRTLSGRVPTYLGILAGNIVLLTGGILAWVMRRRRTVVVACIVCAFSVLFWSMAPWTGRPANPAYGDLSIAELRYLLPAAAVGAFALTLASKGSQLASRMVTAVLAAACAWSLIQTHRMGQPTIPTDAILISGAVIGAALGLLAHRRIAWAAVTWSAASLLAALYLTHEIGGYVSRAAVSSVPDAPVVGWLARQPEFQRGAASVAVAPADIGPLAGDHIRNNVTLIGPRESCAQIFAAQRKGWVVVHFYPQSILALLAPTPAQACVAAERPVYVSGPFRIYGGPGSAEAAQAQTQSHG